MVRRDKLGRIIPEFDRSAANKKGYKTREDKNNGNNDTRLSVIGGRSRTRGYFGQLKDEGNVEELRRLQQAAVEANRKKREKGGTGR